MKRRYVISTIIALIALFSTCSNPFRVGLGDSVDLEPPSVRLLEPASGTFLRETVRISGTATDDRSVRKVEISFDRGTTWRQVDEFDRSAGIWSHSFDTTQVPDGRLFFTVRATDDSDKQSSTDDLLFNVDNTAPVVLVTSPERYDRLVFNTEVVLTVTAADIHMVESFGAIVEQSADEGDTWEEVWTDSVDQSTTWTLVFRSGEFTVNQPQMLFRFFIWAQDEAGNRSTKFYHIDHLREEYPDRVWTADVLLRELSSAESLRGLSIPANRELILRFDEDGDIPDIEWISPQSTDDQIPTTRSRSLLSGIFRDDDGIDLDSMKIRIEEGIDVGDDGPTDWRRVIPPPDSDEDWEELLESLDPSDFGKYKQ